MDMTTMSLPGITPRSQAELPSTGANTDGRVTPNNAITNSENGSGGDNLQNGSSDQVMNNGIFEVCKGILNKMNGLEGRLKDIEDKQLKLSDAVK